jgi:hypothetical protein
VYDALQNQQENMEQPVVIILSEIKNQSHLPSLSLNMTRSEQPHILMYMFCPYVISTPL